MIDTFWIYLLIINFFGGVLFYFDKYRGKNKKRRVPETTLHLLEALGSVFSIVILMHIIHHKNRKKRYFYITYVILTLWILSYLGDILLFV